MESIVVLLVISALLAGWGYKRHRNKHKAVPRGRHSARGIPPRSPVPVFKPVFTPAPTVAQPMLIQGYPAPVGELAPPGTSPSKSVPQKIKIAVSDRDDGKCRKCGTREEPQFDHVIPISRGGANTIANIQILCGTCNRAKGART